MEPTDPTRNEEGLYFSQEIAAMLDAIEQQVEQATGTSHAVTLLRTLILVLEPTTHVHSWEERVLLRAAIDMLTRRLKTLEMFDTFPEE
jgi:hypothetical protein